MKDLFKSTVTIPDIRVDKNHVLPDLVDKPNSFSNFMVEEARYPISYTIQTADSELYVLNCNL